MTVRLIVLLDAGVVGLLCSSPRDAQGLASFRTCRAWLDRLEERADVAIPEITDFEVRRELIRRGANEQLARLDALRAGTIAAQVPPAAWAKAAEFWAIGRRTGIPTASPDALDADAILAGVATTLGGPGDAVTIATTNVRHLARFPGVEARAWAEVG